MRRSFAHRVAGLAVTAAVLFGAARADAVGGLDQLDQVRQAKVGLSLFLLDHLDRPTRISEPCPSLSQESVAAQVAALGLIPSANAYGPAVVVDDSIGAGVAMLRCGNDLARSADPSGSTAVAVDVFMLDGRATFDQYAVAIGGNDVVVETSPDPAGEMAGRCRDGGRNCTWSLNVEGLVVIARAVGLPAETGEQLARQLVAAITPEIIANLAAHAATT